VYDGDELLAESPVKRHAKKRIAINFRLGDILLLAVDADVQRAAMREKETLAGRLTGAVSTNDWDALLQQMQAILTTEWEVAMFIGKRFQQHAGDARRADQDVQKTKSIRDALAAFRTALTAERQDLIKTRNGALHAGVAA